eukprot:824424_1
MKEAFLSNNDSIPVRIRSAASLQKKQQIGSIERDSDCSDIVVVSYSWQSRDLSQEEDFLISRTSQEIRSLDRGEHCDVIDISEHQRSFLIEERIHSSATSLSRIVPYEAAN